MLEDIDKFLLKLHSRIYFVQFCLIRTGLLKAEPEKNCDHKNLILLSSNMGLKKTPNLPVDHHNNKMITIQPIFPYKDTTNTLKILSDDFCNFLRLLFWVNTEIQYVTVNTALAIAPLFGPSVSHLFGMYLGKIKSTSIQLWSLLLLSSWQKECDFVFHACLG